MRQPEDFAEKIGAVKWTFGRADERNHDLNINGQVSLGKVGVEEDTEYGFILKSFNHNTPPETPIAFKRKTYSSDYRVTVPAEILRESGLKPGHTVSLGVYEIEEIQSELVADGDGDIDGDEETEAVREVTVPKETVDQLTELVDQLNGN